MPKSIACSNVADGVPLLVAREIQVAENTADISFVSRGWLRSERSLWVVVSVDGVERVRFSERFGPGPDRNVEVRIPDMPQGRHAIRVMVDTPGYNGFELCPTFPGTYDISGLDNL
jgi:hypothetical protein